MYVHLHMLWVVLVRAVTITESCFIEKECMELCHLEQVAMAKIFHS